jgi:hypothetical protein
METRRPPPLASGRSPGFNHTSPRLFAPSRDVDEGFGLLGGLHEAPSGISQLSIIGTLRGSDDCTGFSGMSFRIQEDVVRALADFLARQLGSYVPEVSRGRRSHAVPKHGWTMEKSRAKDAVRAEGGKPVVNGRWPARGQERPQPSKSVPSRVVSRTAGARASPGTGSKPAPSRSSVLISFSARTRRSRSVCGARVATRRPTTFSS